MDPELPDSDPSPVGSRVAGLRSDARHAGEELGEADWKWSRVARVWSGMRLGAHICGFRVGQSDVANATGSPHIRPTYGLGLGGAGQPGRMGGFEWSSWVAIS